MRLRTSVCCEAIDAVIDDGRYILGPQVAEFEKQLAAYVGVKHVVACANGTDALLLPLLASGIGPGDAVFVPSFTFAATAEVVALAHAEPVFVDVDPDTLAKQAMLGDNQNCQHARTRKIFEQ